jgi:hypothetical protein
MHNLEYGSPARQAKTILGPIGALAAVGAVVACGFALSRRLGDQHQEEQRPVARRLRDLVGSGRRSS